MKGELQVLQSARLIELVCIRYTQRQQRVQIMRVGVDRVSQARNRLVVVVGIRVGLAERLPRDCVLWRRLHRGFEHQHRFGQLAGTE